MAVSVQAPLYPNSGMWNLGDPPTPFTSASDGPAAMASYQYPPPPTSRLEPASSTMIPSFHHPPDQTLPTSPIKTSPASPGLKNRVNSAVSKSAKIKRSMSTPNVRGQASAEAAALALSAEKRRNKLGYHRTSVACGHCRRRKIRCIAAPNDPANRCSNCIRLKKECSFYPVDQPPQPVDPRRRDSTAKNGTEGASEESSSPSTASGTLPEMSSNLPPSYARLNMPSIQDLGGPLMKKQRTESFSPENKVVTSSRPYEYSHGTTAAWMGPEASPGIKPESGAPGPPYWRTNPQESPLTPAFSPYANPGMQIPPPHGQNQWPPVHAEPSPREEWPQRSISYSSLDTLHNQGPQHYSPYNQQPPGRALQTSGMYPPPISTTTSTMAPTEPSPAPSMDRPQHPFSAHSLPPVPMSPWQQQHQPGYYGKPASAGTEQYGGSWNGPSPSHGPPAQGDNNHPPTPAYGYGETSAGYYPPPAHHGR